MRICSEKLNVTFGFTSMTANELVIVEERRIRGYLGGILSNYLGLNQRHHLCKLVATSGIGQKLPNGSWTGSFQMLKEK